MSVFDELAGLATLPANWDSYGAYEITEAAIAAASELLRNPRVMAQPDGGVGVAWETDRLRIDVTLLPDGSFGDSTVERLIPRAPTPGVEESPE